ncbi:MAG: ion channel [Candidatus Kryptoniota bacterium]
MRKFWKTARGEVSANLIPVLSAVVGLVIVGALLVYFAEWHNGQINSYWDAVWWAVVTITTVGYGDIVPHTVLGRVVGILVMLSGISVISLLTATISSIFITRRIRESQGLQQIKLKGHTIVCGWNQRLDGLLGTMNKISSEESNGQGRREGVVLINEMPPGKMEETFSDYPNLNLKYVRGDYTKEPTLARANIKEARAVIILPDMSLTSVPRDDKTLPAALAIKSMKRDIKVYAHIIDRENFSHLKRANVDNVIISDEHVGYLLASDISSPGIAQTVAALLSCEAGTSLKRVQVPAEFVGKKFHELQEYFKSQLNSIAIGFVSEEESVKLSDILSSDYSAIDSFIERKFKAAGLDMLERGGVRLSLNPPLDYVIHEKEDAIIIG